MHIGGFLHTQSTAKKISVYLKTMQYNGFVLDKKAMQFQIENPHLVSNMGNSVSKLHCSS
jgi:hypothetical protein